MTIEGAGWKDADDAVRLVVEEQIAIEDAAIAAEVLLPRGVAQDDDAIGAGTSSSARKLLPISGCTPKTAK